MPNQALKQAAALEALTKIKNVRTLGVGTGSTVDFFIAGLAQNHRHLDAIVSSSQRTTQTLKKHGIPVTDCNHVTELDIYVDGADECTPHGAMLKGGGGALTGEKILSHMAKHFICIIDDSKLVPMLGNFPLALEVIPLARSMVARHIVQMGGAPDLRPDTSTDYGNIILDVQHLDFTDPAQMERKLNNIPGAVTNGVFALRGADLLLIGSNSGVKEVST